MARCTARLLALILEVAKCKTIVPEDLRRWVRLGYDLRGCALSLTRGPPEVGRVYGQGVHSACPVHRATGKVKGERES